jgi:hypothetical protein
VKSLPFRDLGLHSEFVSETMKKKVALKVGLESAARQRFNHCVAWQKLTDAAYEVDLHPKTSRKPHPLTIYMLFVYGQFLF